ncbi:MAG: hypothetical protein N2246_10695, partial [Candidatus Sumerlaeia bacterium]|nr:hypothetical protein [Candidatus Sumerlaeia bacterium]
DDFLSLWETFLDNMERSKLQKLNKVLILDSRWNEPAFLPMSESEYQKYKELPDFISGNLPVDDAEIGEDKVNRRTKLEHNLG